MESILPKDFFSRSTDSNKYDFGHVLIIGGSPGMVGAPLLSAMSALRVGAGLTTIASSKEVIDKLEKRVLEVMTFRIPDESQNSDQVILEFINMKKISVVIMGPGMDLDSSTLVKKLVPKILIPTVLDAGAVTCFHDDIELLENAAKSNPHIVLTPHDGEFKKLTGETLSTEPLARQTQAIEFAQNYNVTLICKGSSSLVAHTDGEIYKNSTGNPGMATAGTGDVLSGIIAGLISQGLDVSKAADVGVHLHGLAGDLAAENKTQPGMIASDLIEYLPLALRKMS